MQAVQLVTSQEPGHFSVILLDINMPIMGGLEACQRIGQHLLGGSSRAENYKKQTLIYAVSQDVSEDMVEQIHAAPFDGKYDHLTYLEAKQIQKAARELQQ